MRGFVFSVVFIILFAALLSSIPAGLQGQEETPETVIPINPSLVSGFSETETWNSSQYVSYQYSYDDFSGRDWISSDLGASISLGAKVYFLFLWFGKMDDCRFTSSDGTERGTSLSFTEIDADADEGAVSYSLLLTTSGDSAGSLVVYWNSTEYTDSSDAWDAGELFLLHGVGIETTATADIGALLIALLFLQLPDVPVLVNLFIAVPPWAAIIFILWFIFKETTPFL